MKFIPPALGFYATNSINVIHYEKDMGSVEVKSNLNISDEIPIWGLARTGEIVTITNSILRISLGDTTVETIEFDPTSIQFTHILPNESLTQFALTDTSGNLWILQR